jgi:RHS repeat-associated protein
VNDAQLCRVTRGPSPRRTSRIEDTDHLNTVRLVADSTGTTVWRRDNQEPFGDSPADENPSGLGVFEFDLGFPGQRRDRETGLWYNYQRDCYDAALGRYCQSDPIGLAAGLNTYAYVDSSPLRYTDSSGLFIDVLADIGFIAYDLYAIVRDGSCNLDENVTALGLDVLGAVIPGVTGLGAAARAARTSKVAKSKKTEDVGRFTKTTEVQPGVGPGQSRAEYVRYKNEAGETIRTHKDTYDRAGIFQHRKPLRGGPEGRIN